MDTNILRSTRTPRNLSDLPSTDQLALLKQICAYLTEKYICPDVFASVTAELEPVAIAELPKTALIMYN